MARIIPVVAVLFSPFFLAGQPANPNSKYSQFEKKLKGDKEILHALNRLAYGPRPGDVEAVKKIGLNKWIDLQLHPERIPDNPSLTELIEPLMSTPTGPGRGGFGIAAVRGKVFVMNGQPLNQLITPEQTRLLRMGTDKQALDLLATFPKEKVVQVLAAMPVVRNRLLALLDPDLRRKVVAAAPSGPQQPGSNVAQAKLFQAIQSERQLQEVLVDFWFNHFNVDAGKGRTSFMLADYERNAIRPHVLGKFRDLLGATANSAAMMFYLDNWQSSVAPPEGAEEVKALSPARVPAQLIALLKQKPSGLNENYARELMELHTLGVNGGYTQKDVIEVARCFTGWTIESNQNGGVAQFGPNFAVGLGGNFAYKDEMHDKGEKTALGVTIPAGGGKEDGEKILDILARHPSTARFISKELAERFVADDPPPALVERMAATFQSSDGDIRAVLSTMFNSKEFFSEGAYRSKLKTPLEFVVSATRAMGAQPENTLPLVTAIASMGQPLYRKVEPTGYSNLGSKWVSSASLVERMNFALDLSQNRIPGVKVDEAKLSHVPETAARQLLFKDPEQETLDAVKAGFQQDDSKTSGGLLAGLLIGAPEFQRR